MSSHPLSRHASLFRRAREPLADHIPLVSPEKGVRVAGAGCRQGGGSASSSGTASPADGPLQHRHARELHAGGVWAQHVRALPHRVPGLRRHTGARPPRRPHELRPHHRDVVLQVRGLRIN